MKRYIVKHEPSNTFIIISDEMGPCSVPIDQVQLFNKDMAISFLDPSYPCLEYVEGIEGVTKVEDFSVYEVEVIILQKVNI